MPFEALTTSNSALDDPIVLEQPRRKTDLTYTFRVRNTTGGLLNTFSFVPSGGISTETAEPLSLANNANVDIVCTIAGSSLKRGSFTNYSFTVNASGGNTVTVNFRAKQFQVKTSPRKRRR